MRIILHVHDFLYFQLDADLSCDYILWEDFGQYGDQYLDYLWSSTQVWLLVDYLREMWTLWVWPSWMSMHQLKFHLTSYSEFNISLFKFQFIPWRWWNRIVWWQAIRMDGEKSRLNWYLASVQKIIKLVSKWIIEYGVNSYEWDRDQYFGKKPQTCKWFLLWV